MRKVYCKNCKYSKYYDNEELKSKIDCNYGNWFCGFKDLVIIDCIGYEIRIGDFSTSACKELNKDCHCKHYKRKWWMFWIKQPKLSGKVDPIKQWPAPQSLKEGSVKKGGINKPPKTPPPPPPKGQR